MQYETVEYSLDGHVATVTLNRPERRNAISAALRRDVVAAFEAANSDPQVRAIILTGAGTVFCAGRDLTPGAQDPDTDRALHEFEQGRIFPMVVRQSARPVICAVNGPARGAGCNLAFAADFRIISGRADFAVNFIERGLMPELGAKFLTDLVGLHVASEICLLGEAFGADQALRWGLAHEVAEPEELLPRARAWAERASKGAPLAVQATKRALREAASLSVDAYAAAQTSWIEDLSRTDDVREGAIAFRERREPLFQGR
jgi:enoyl-CoA hydratase/carnithine racemase